MQGAGEQPPNLIRLVSLMDEIPSFLELRMIIPQSILRQEQTNQ